MNEIGRCWSHRPRFWDPEAMNTNNSSIENSIGLQADVSPNYISGPHWEELMIPTTTNYWYCESYGYESTHRRDLYRKSFHASDYEVRS